MSSSLNSFETRAWTCSANNALFLSHFSFSNKITYFKVAHTQTTFSRSNFIKAYRSPKFRFFFTQKCKAPKILNQTILHLFLKENKNKIPKIYPKTIQQKLTIELILTEYYFKVRFPTLFSKPNLETFLVEMFSTGILHNQAKL